MKLKLYIKFFAGYKIGQIHSCKVNPTQDTDDAVRDIRRVLQRAGFKVELSRLRLMLRRAAPALQFCDGIFSDRNGTFGYLLYGPSVDCSIVDDLLFHTLDPVPFFIAYDEGVEDGLFTGEALPFASELPNENVVHWTQESGATAAASGLFGRHQTFNS